MNRPAFGKSLVEFKKLFFDRGAVEKAAGRAKIKALSRFGAVVRRVAQTSMRYRKSASKPGQPPSAHKSKRLASLKKMGRARHNGALLRELLFFAYDPKTGSVVVGPVGFKTKGTPVPALHEFGGERQGGKGDVVAKKTGRGRKAGVEIVSLAGKTLRYPPRPFMSPALKKSMPKFAQSFKGTVSR
jgi:hypothetical protein